MLQQKGEQIFEDIGGSETTASGNSNYEIPCKFPNEVYEDNIEIQKSFEVFQGKLFYNSKLQSLGGNVGMTSLPTRMARLLEEYTLIKFEIDTMVNQNKNMTDDQTIWLTLQNTAKSHIQDLQAQNLLIPSTSQTVDSIHLDNEIKSISAPPVVDKSNNISNFQTKGSLDGTTYAIDMVKLDRRINAIESIVGSTSRMMPLTKAANKLDSQISSLNSIDDLQQKVANLKTELGTILNSKSQREVKLIEGSLAIKTMNTKLNQFNDLSHDLPIIATRLKMLDGVHRSSLAYLNRLHNIETLTAKISGSISNNEQVLRSLKSVSSFVFLILIL
jgi:hypothetical protein